MNNPLAAIKGDSLKITELIKMINKVSSFVELPVLITGETGTGKELVADSLHASSPLADKPYIKINCSSIPDTLLESTLFGAIKGAFTGSTHLQVGLIEEANGGTLFLDEIGELHIELQPKILRFLENGFYRRIGNNVEKYAQVRIIAATNRNLPEEIKKGTFRKDLFYRLKGIELRIPPLRERKQDILILAEHFLNSNGYSRTVPTVIGQDLKDILETHSWPGNVRELKYFLEQIAALAEGGEINCKNVPSSVLESLLFPNDSSELLTLEEMERRHILKIFKKNRWAN